MSLEVVVPASPSTCSHGSCEGSPGFGLDGLHQRCSMSPRASPNCSPAWMKEQEDRFGDSGWRSPPSALSFCLDSPNKGKEQNPLKSLSIPTSLPMPRPSNMGSRKRSAEVMSKTGRKAASPLGFVSSGLDSLSIHSPHFGKSDKSALLQDSILMPPPLPSIFNVAPVPCGPVPAAAITPSRSLSFRPRASSFSVRHAVGSPSQSAPLRSPSPHSLPRSPRFTPLKVLHKNQEMTPTSPLAFSPLNVADRSAYGRSRPPLHHSAFSSPRPGFHEATSTPVSSRNELPLVATPSKTPQETTPRTPVSLPRFSLTPRRTPHSAASDDMNDASMFVLPSPSHARASRPVKLRIDESPPHQDQGSIARSFALGPKSSFTTTTTTTSHSLLYPSPVSSQGPADGSSSLIGRNIRLSPQGLVALERCSLSDQDSEDDDDEFVLVPPTALDLRTHPSCRHSRRRRFSLEDETVAAMTTLEEVIFSDPPLNPVWTTTAQGSPHQFHETRTDESPASSARSHQQLELAVSATPPQAELSPAQSPPLLHVRRTIG
jgi:hypothetical protein